MYLHAFYTQLRFVPFESVAKKISQSIKTCPRQRNVLQIQLDNCSVLPFAVAVVQILRPCGREIVSSVINFNEK